VYVALSPLRGITPPGRIGGREEPSRGEAMIIREPQLDQRDEQRYVGIRKAVSMRELRPSSRIRIATFSDGLGRTGSLPPARPSSATT
jgi:hypothetical protein